MNTTTLIVGSLAISGAMFWILQSLEDRRRVAGAPPSSIASRVLLWFFVWLIVLCLMYFGEGAMGGGSSAGAPGPAAAPAPKIGGGIDREMLRRIPCDIEVGLPTWGEPSAV